MSLNGRDYIKVVYDESPQDHIHKAKMTRNLWLSKDTKYGQIIVYKGVKYRVLRETFASKLKGREKQAYFTVIEEVTEQDIEDILLQ